jgi:hypothetical protein
MECAFGDGSLKRHRMFCTIEILALLMTVATALSPAPAILNHESGFGFAGDFPQAELNDTHQGLVINGASSVGLNTSRIHESSLSGIVPQSVDSAGLSECGWGIPVILPVSSREIGFHSRLRAPPVFLLS